MLESRLRVETERDDQGRPGFVAAPVIVGSAPVLFQQQLYQWAFQQAQKSMARVQRKAMPDLFAIMN
jgi:hypothetical protein